MSLGNDEFWNGNVPASAGSDAGGGHEDGIDLPDLEADEPEKRDWKEYSRWAKRIGIAVMAAAFGAWIISASVAAMSALPEKERPLLLKQIDKTVEAITRTEDKSQLSLEPKARKELHALVGDALVLSDEIITMLEANHEEVTTQ